jgi:hypothetical protein
LHRRDHPSRGEYLEVDADATIESIIDLLGMSPALVKLVLLNGFRAAGCALYRWGCTGDLAADRERLIMTSDAEIILRFETGYTPAEFRQRLPDVEYDPARSQFDHVKDGRRWSLRLSEPRERVIGSLRVPGSMWNLCFNAMSQPI